MVSQSGVTFNYDCCLLFRLFLVVSGWPASNLPPISQLALPPSPGHLEVPRSGTFGDTNLLKWLMRQREQFKNEKLSTSRIKMLRDLDFDFDGNSEKRDKQVKNLKWKEGYGELLSYHKTNGTVCFPKNCSPSEKRLEKWLARQKVAYQYGDLEPDRKALLMELGVEFVEVSLAAQKSSRAGVSEGKQKVPETQNNKHSREGVEAEKGNSRRKKGIIAVSKEQPQGQDSDATEIVPGRASAGRKRRLDSPTKNAAKKAPEKKRKEAGNEELLNTSTADV